MTQPQTAPVRPKSDDELVHLICRDAPDVSYCGLDVSGGDAWHPDVIAPECVVCHDLRVPGFGCPTCYRHGGHR